MEITKLKIIYVQNINSIQSKNLKLHIETTSENSKKKKVDVRLKKMKNEKLVLNDKSIDVKKIQKKIKKEIDFYQV